jgi:hypothetical protein
VSVPTYDPVRLRLLLAAVLAATPLGLVWSFHPGWLTPGIVLAGTCDYYTEDYVCAPDSYVPGWYVPGKVELVSESPARVFLLFAAIAFVVVAARRRTAATRLAARMGTVSLGVATLLAGAAGVRLVLLLCVAALAVVARPVWHTGRPPAPLAPARRAA